MCKAASVDGDTSGYSMQSIAKDKTLDPMDSDDSLVYAAQRDADLSSLCTVESEDESSEDMSFQHFEKYINDVGGGMGQS